MLTSAVEKLWAVVCDEPGEGLCAMFAPNGVVLPLITADEAKIGWLSEMAETIGRQKPVKIVLFERREIVREINPPLVGS